MTTTSAAPARVGRWLAAALAAFLLGLGLLCANFAVHGHVFRVRQAQCNHMFEPITEQMPWYALPLAITATVLLLMSVVLSVVAFRRAYPGGSHGLIALSVLLIIVFVLATLFTFWFGVYGTIADTPIIPRRCVG